MKAMSSLFVWFVRMQIALKAKSVWDTVPLYRAYNLQTKEGIKLTP